MGKFLIFSLLIVMGYCNPEVRLPFNKTTRVPKRWLNQQHNNDESIGEDWINSNDLIDGISGHRFTRAVGKSMNDSIITMIEVAHQTLGRDQMDIGDSYTFKFIMDLPEIEASDKSHLNLQFFSIDPNDGVSGFHICQPHIDRKGSMVKTLQPEPIYADQYDQEHPNIVKKSTITLENLHTDGYGEDDDEGKVTAQFQAVVAKTEDLTSSTKYYITGGAEYGDGAYVWVNQFDVTTQLQMQDSDFDTNIELAVAPTSLAKGDAGLFVLTAYVTHPGTSFEFGIYQPLGYEDVFHIGHVQRHLGNAFGCSQEKFWSEKYVPSSTGLSNTNFSTSYPFLLNRDAQRDVTKDVNRIKFEIPVQVLNSNRATTGIERMLTFVVKVGTVTMFSALHEVTIQETIPAQQNILNPENIVVRMLNGDEPIKSGGAAVYEVIVTVPAGWIRFDAEMIGDSSQLILPAGAKIIDGGLVAYFPPTWSVKNATGSTMKIGWGILKNVSPSGPTNVKLEVSFSIGRGSPTGRKDMSKIQFSVGGRSAELQSFDVVESPANSEVDVTGVKLSSENSISIHQHAQIGMDIEFTVPDGAGNEDFYFEAVPDVTIDDVSIRICRARIHKIGANLPCLYSRHTHMIETLNKSLDTLEYNNYGEIKINRLCPVKIDPAPEANKFLASFYYEVMQSATTPTAGVYTLGGGIRHGTKKIWISTESYPVNVSEYLTQFTSVNFTSGNNAFFSAYPIITTRDRIQEAFDRKEGVFLQYIVKPQPLSTSTYTFQFAGKPGFQVCKVVISHIGENLACMRLPQETPQESDNIEITYDHKECGNSPTVKFKNMRNFGRDPIVQDLTTDANAIQIKIYMKVCEDAAEDSHSFANKFEYKGQSGDVSLTDTFEIKTSDKDKAPSATEKIVGLKYSSLIGPDNLIYKKISKLMKIDFSIPPGYLGDITIEIINDQYDNNVPVDFCGASVITVGQNIPCLDIDKHVTYESGTESKEVNGQTIQKSFVIKLKDVCYFDVDRSPESSMVTLEVGVRIRDDTPNGDQIKFTVKAIPVSSTLTQSIEIGPLTVTPFDSNVIKEDTVVPSELKVYPKPGPEIQVSTGEKVWVTFHVSLPALKTVKMEASFLLPAIDGVGVLHATDVKFGNPTNATSYHMNVLCTLPTCDLRNAFPTEFSQTSNLSTFMQKDSVTIDLGYMVNAGFSKKRDVYEEDHDDFAISIEVQLSDQASTINDAQYDVHFSVQFGEIVVVTSEKVHVNRPSADRKNEIADLILQATMEEPSDVPLKSMDDIHINTILKHSPDSKGEGYPTYLTVMLPTYISYENGGFQTNYTIQNVSNPLELVPLVNNPNIFYFKFSHGLTYPDIVELNFTLKVDYHKKKIPGSPVNKLAILLKPTCRQNIIDGFPNKTDNQNLLYCGNPKSFPVRIMAEECMDEITFVNECQVRASSMVSQLFKPFNVLSSSAVWCPANRDLEVGQNYVEFDFLSVARINKIYIGSETFVNPRSFRVIKKAIIKGGFGFNNYRFFKEVDLTQGNEIILSTPLVARYVQIIIKEVSSSDAETNLLGVNKVRFYGCLPRGHVPDTSKCFPASTVDASTSIYRSFAVHDEKEVVFFCDTSIFLGTPLCYFTIKGKDNAWRSLPGYLKRILGYSPARGRMYLSDLKGEAVVSTLDGEQLDMTGSILPDDIIQPVAVPGDVASNIGDKPWTGQLFSYKANFQGIFKEDRLMVEWKACCRNIP